MKLLKLLLLLSIVLSITAITSCKPPKKENKEVAKETVKKKYPVVKETAMTPWNDIDNIDSPTFYQSEDGKTNLLIATSKANHNLWVYNPETGDFIKTIGHKGKELGEFKRPNGVWVIDDYLLVCERDNHRVQILKLPDFEPIGTVGQSDLLYPYGLTVYKDKAGVYQMYVTDNFEGENDAPYPTFDKLNNRVHHYSFSISSGKLDWKLEKKFGDTKGKGMLWVVESIYADPENNNLLIAEEDKNNLGIKVYDLKGNFKGVIISEVNDKDLFVYQAEGMALYDCGNGEGFWIATDQDYYKTKNNTFHFFDRKTFDYIGSFISEKTDNTDGCWLTQKPFGKFDKGAFFAVHDDGGVGIINWKDIEATLKLKCK